jgi:hypothetical protein
LSAKGEFASFAIEGVAGEKQQHSRNQQPFQTST